MSNTIKCFKNFMKVEEIKGQRILTSFLPPEDSSRTEIFVKNIPQNLEEEDIVTFFESVGPLHCLRLMMNKNNEGNRGFAYITYLKSDDAMMAIKLLNGKEIVSNYPVVVTHSMNNCRIFLGGIPVRKTKDEVWQELNKKGISNIIDVIMYRSYNNRSENRGFVFVEFPTHQYAAKMRNKMKGLCVWGNEVVVDWSVPEPVVPEEDMMKVKILYLRNLRVMETREYLKAVIGNYVNPEFVQRVYKFKNYAFIHLISREVALKLLFSLREHYHSTPVEVTFAKPPSEYTKPEYRKHMLSKTLSACSSKTEPEPQSINQGHHVDVRRSRKPLREISPSSLYPENNIRSQRKSSPSDFTYNNLLFHPEFMSSPLKAESGSFHTKFHANPAIDTSNYSEIWRPRESLRDVENLDSYTFPDIIQNSLLRRVDNAGEQGNSSVLRKHERANYLQLIGPSSSYYKTDEHKLVASSIPTNSIQSLNSVFDSLKIEVDEFQPFKPSPSNREMPEKLSSIDAEFKSTGKYINGTKNKENEENLEYFRMSESPLRPRRTPENTNMTVNCGVLGGEYQYSWPSFPCSWNTRSNNALKPLSPITNIPSNDRSNFEPRRSLLETCNNKSSDQFNIEKDIINELYTD